MDKIVTSTANAAVKRLKSLNLKKHRGEGAFLVEGLRHIHEALCAGWEPDTFVFSPSARQEKLFKGVLYHDSLKGKECFETTDEILSRITDRDNAQPALAVFKQKWHELSEVKDGLWVGLEGVRDPGNLGTIIRTAHAAGAAGIILIGECCDPWSPEAVRATMGSFARVKLAQAGRPDFLKWRAGWKGGVIGTHLQSATDYRTLNYELPLLLLMGSEQAGLSPEISKTCDTLAKIPMTGGAESLNLAVSAGIMIFEAARTRV